VEILGEVRGGISTESAQELQKCCSTREGAKTAFPIHERDAVGQLLSVFHLRNIMAMTLSTLRQSNASH